MSDIQVGEYIRSNRGHIGKLKRIEFDKNDKGLKWYIFDYKKFGIIQEEYINKPYIVSHSPNIIDLIEEGDYVNGKLVYSVGTAIGSLPIVNNTDGTFTPENMIKSIVTHEQFLESEYRKNE